MSKHRSCVDAYVDASDGCRSRRNNLGDYRTIGRYQLRFPEGYFASPYFESDE